METQDIDKAALRRAILLVGAWILWILTDIVDVSIAYGASRFVCVIDIVGISDPPLWRWLTGSLGVAAIAWAELTGCCDSGRWRSVVWLISGLAVGRAVSLVPVVGSLIPPVGLLWTPHMSWALSLTVLLLPATALREMGWIPRDRVILVGLIAVFGLIYGAYGLFFVRTTILHGDEPQFLMVSQSLVRDGDIDLSNAERGDHREFHQLDFVGAHKAPASPDGKIHNVHPIGPSLLLAPSYWLGKRLLDHPRLTASLTIALLTTLVLGLTYLLLRTQEFDPLVSVLTCVTVGFTPLVFLYSNQIYPDIPALLLTIPAMIVAARQSSTKLLYLVSFGLSLFLPLMHPRLLPLTAVLSFFLYQRVRESSDREDILKWAGGMAIVAFVGYVSYHLHYTGDIWGAYKPGNAWKAYTPTMTSFLTGITGQWLDYEIGLLANAPVFGLAIPGVVMLHRSGRRDLAYGILLVYLVTAGVNANSDDWRFRYCYASRFMITALPALVVPLAVVVNRGMSREPVLLLVFCFGASIGVDTTLEALTLTEAAYLGKHLNDRAIASLYPIALHFANLKSGIPWTDGAVWLIVAAVPFLVPASIRPRSPIALGACVILLAIAGSAQSTRLSTQTSARMPTLEGENVRPTINQFERRLLPQRGAES